MQDRAWFSGRMPCCLFCEGRGACDTCALTTLTLLVLKCPCSRPHTRPHTPLAHHRRQPRITLDNVTLLVPESEVLTFQSLPHALDPSAPAAATLPSIAAPDTAQWHQAWRLAQQAAGDSSSLAPDNASGIAAGPVVSAPDMSYAGVQLKQATLISQRPAFFAELSTNITPVAPGLVIAAPVAPRAAEAGGGGQGGGLEGWEVRLHFEPSARIWVQAH
jgi:hypothetical protein